MMPIQHAVEIWLAVPHSVLQVDWLKVENNETATLNIEHHFFPGLFVYVYIESPNPKNPEGPTHHIKSINWKPQPQKPNVRPQPQNYHKWAKIRKKNYKE